MRRYGYIPPKWIDESKDWYAPIKDGDYVCFSTDKVHFMQFSGSPLGGIMPMGDTYACGESLTPDFMNCTISGIVNCEDCLIARIEALYGLVDVNRDGLGDHRHH